MLRLRACGMRESRKNEIDGEVVNMWHAPILRLALLAALAITACAPAGQPAGAPGATGGDQASGASSRTLAVAIRVEPPTVATRPLETAGIALYLPSRMFNAEVALFDNNGSAHPYLAEALPQLNSESWRLFPDGRMETTYRLNPDVTWHDGTSLSAGDFVFGWQVYATPALGHTGSAPLRAIEEVRAPDARTVLIRWRQVFPDVSLSERFNLPPLPRHILEATFQPDQLEPFAANPYWTREYVGLGPYQMSQWESGAFIEAVRFDGHILGASKISKIRLDFAADPRTALARILAGEAQLTDGSSVGLSEVALLKEEWIPQGKGDVFIHPNQWRAAHFQHRPELVNPQTLLNRTMRKALAHAIDKTTLNETLNFGLGIVTDSPIAPNSIWGAAAERGAVKYLYDLRRTDELMQQAGFRKGPDGVYTSPTEGRLAWVTQTNSGEDNESEMSVLAANWRQAGFDVEEQVLSRAEARDPEKRSTYPATFSHSTGCCEPALLAYASDNISRAETGWTGGNRWGWSAPEYDRLLDAFTQSLQRTEREQQVEQMVRLSTDDVESITLAIRGQPWVYVSDLKGIVLVPPEGNMSWNIHDWEFR
ncbi:MAG: hypothetical protein GEU73_14725 [Chloroflexi bacterium]|nr:hypothetical protein [Chloroflexota bacterium]